MFVYFLGRTISNFRLVYLQESQRQSTSNAQPYRYPPTDDHLFIREHATCIPNQMSQSVYRMVRKWPRESRLGQNLRDDRPAGECRGDGRRFEMPAEGGCDEVGNSEQVERATQSDACDAVQTAAYPRHLGSIDGEMRGHGTMAALCCENRFGVIVAHGCGCCWSASSQSYNER